MGSPDEPPAVRRAGTRWLDHTTLADEGSRRERTAHVAGTVVASLLDDVANSLLVWQGALNKTIDPLLLSVRDLPGRS